MLHYNTALRIPGSATSITGSKDGFGDVHQNIQMSLSRTHVETQKHRNKERQKHGKTETQSV